MEPIGEGAMLHLNTEKTYACELIEIIVLPSREGNEITLDVKGLNNSICAPAYMRASWIPNMHQLPEHIKPVVLEPGTYRLFLRHNGNEDEYVLDVGNGSASIRGIRTTFSSAAWWDANARRLSP
ncbi:MAG: hypothetical protein ABIG39_04045 [Candidatus Micrarchaeota archaeon]